MERKEIIKALGEHFGVEPKYMGVPSFAYEIATGQETYNIDRAGMITTLEGKVSAEKVKAYTQLVALLNQNAKDLKHASAKAKAKDTDNDKFTFRVWLVKLGMIGDEYKSARKVLLEKLEGNSAFRSGSKPEKVVVE